MLTRRALMHRALLLTAGLPFARSLRSLGQGDISTSIRILPGQPLASVPDNFTGLGYEMSSAAQPELLSAQNTDYVRLVSNLGRSGVLRFGGIVADYTRYVAAGPVRTDPKDTVVSRASLVQLRGFLDAIGWRAIWSVNFGQGTIEDAITEAKDVQRMLGPRLLAIELGNEVENYSRGKKPLRTPPYDFAAYHAEYSTWRHKLLAAVPGLRFAAPDTAASVDWVEHMAAQAHGDVQLLTTHYYRGDQRQGTLAQLMQPDPELFTRLRRLREASRKSGIPWRMCETNSFFGGGRPGLSDTFADALWTLNYMLLLAQYGCAGVNIETGVNQLGFVSSYSPIRYDSSGRPEAGAPYYGMLAFAAAGAAGAQMLQTQLSPGNPDLAAYAIGRHGRIHSLVLINRSSTALARVSLSQLALPSPKVLRLTAPTVLSKSGITLGGSAVNAQGGWRAQATEHLQGDKIAVPAASAAILLSSKS